MGAYSFEIYSVSDTELISQVEKLIAQLGLGPETQLVFELLGVSNRTSLTVETFSKNETLKMVRESGYEIVNKIRISTEPGAIEFLRDRERARIKVDVNHPDSTPVERVVTVACTIQSGFSVHLPSTRIPAFLSPELRDVYEKREEALARLEALSCRLLEENDSYRRKLLGEIDQRRDQLDVEYEERQKKLEAQIAAKSEEMKKRSEELDARSKQLDDRSSKHARRDIRKDMKTILAQRNERFTLTKSTGRKRIWVHALFIILLATLGAVIVRDVVTETSASTGEWGQFIYLGRTALAIVGFVGISVFYIKWNDRWFQSHADEEFKLKRLDLDIDRASWVVEMALEWKDEKGSEIPPELMERLTSGLFEEPRSRKELRHPTEDLASALLRAAAALRLKVPGAGEIELDKRGIQSLARSRDNDDE